jgi:hypothetical protein
MLIIPRGRRWRHLTWRVSPRRARPGLAAWPPQAVTFSLTEFKVFPVRRSSIPVVICETP